MNENSSNPTDQPTENNCSSIPPPSTPDMNRSRATKRQAVETPKKYSFKNRSSSGSCPSLDRLKEYIGPIEAADDIEDNTSKKSRIRSPTAKPSNTSCNKLSKEKQPQQQTSQLKKKQLWTSTT